MVKSTEKDQVDQNNVNLSNELTKKINYLDELKTSLKNENDLKIYQLINPVKFKKEVGNSKEKVDETGLFDLAADLTPELSHHLSDRLIEYLGKKYPFFYYHEYELGKFSIYFGNWWDHHMFGDLDVVNVQFLFDEDEYNKLAQSFVYEADGRRINDLAIRDIAKENEDLEKIMADQKNRDAKKAELHEAINANDEKNPMPWDASKVREERQQLTDQLIAVERADEIAANAPKNIKENENKILKLSKDETILGFEKQSIRATFGDFDSFNEQNDKLYKDYLNSLKKVAKVTEND